MRVKGGGSTALILAAGITPFAVAACGFAFFQGVSLLRANLSEGQTPDVLVEVNESAFSPVDITVEVGTVLEWRNTGNTPQQFRSDESNADGSPLLTSSLLQPTETFRLTVPPFLAGKTLMLRSAYIPTIRGTLTVKKVPEGAAAILSPPAAQQPPSVPVAEIPPSPPETLTPVLPAPSPPPLPSAPLPLSPLPPPPVPVLHVGATEIARSTEGWPFLLRINRFTVDRVPSLSPVSQLPIHSVARAQEQVRSTKAKRSPLARKQPETGPALWIVAALSLCGVPLLLRKEKRRS